MIRSTSSHGRAISSGAHFTTGHRQTQTSFETNASKLDEGSLGSIRELLVHGVRSKANANSFHAPRVFYTLGIQKTNPENGGTVPRCRCQRSDPPQANVFTVAARNALVPRPECGWLIEVVADSSIGAAVGAVHGLHQPPVPGLVDGQGMFAREKVCRVPLPFFDFQERNEAGQTEVVTSVRRCFHAEDTFFPSVVDGKIVVVHVMVLAEEQGAVVVKDKGLGGPAQLEFVPLRRLPFAPNRVLSKEARDVELPRVRSDAGHDGRNKVHFGDEPTFCCVSQNFTRWCANTVASQEQSSRKTCSATTER